MTHIPQNMQPPISTKGEEDLCDTKLMMVGYCLFPSDPKVNKVRVPILDTSPLERTI